MQWQDAVIAIGNWLFFLFLLPMWCNPPALKSSVPTGLTLLVFGHCFATLGLANSAAASVSCGIMWLALAVKKFITEK